MLAMKLLGINHIYFKCANTKALMNFFNLDDDTTFWHFNKEASHYQLH